MRVTIALLTWNHAANIAAAIAALRAQDYPDLEILVQDDGSRDDTLLVAERAAVGDPRVRLLKTPHNLGGWGNLALAAERASGDFICWACPGDWWAPDFVSSLVVRLQDRPNAVVAMGGTIDIDEATRSECGRRSLVGPKSPERFGWFRLACAVLMKSRPAQNDRPHYSLMLHGLVARKALLGVLGAYRGLGPILNERGVLAHLALIGPFAVSERWLFKKERHELPALVRGPHVASRKARTVARLIYTRTAWQILRAMLRSAVLGPGRKLAAFPVVGQYFVRSVAEMVFVRAVAWMNRSLPSGIYRILRWSYRFFDAGHRSTTK